MIDCREDVELRMLGKWIVDENSHEVVLFLKDPTRKASALTSAFALGDKHDEAAL